MGPFQHFQKMTFPLSLNREEKHVQHPQNTINVNRALFKTSSDMLLGRSLPTAGFDSQIVNLSKTSLYNEQTQC